jgi:membrane protease YdiL (CAAX protease family)
MADQVTKNPAIRQGWLRVLIFGAVLFAVTTILVLLIVFPLLLAQTGGTPDQIKSNLSGYLVQLGSGNYLWVIFAIEFAAAFISVWVCRKWIDRKSWTSLGWTSEGFGSEAAAGLFMGPALLGITAILLLVTGHLEWTDIIWDPSSLFISLGMMVLIAFSEEVIFRGYILSNLLESFSNKWLALGISAILFAALHFGNPGISALAVVNLFLAGLLLGINYIYTRNLWFSILFHFSWNFFQGPILGCRVSGLSLPSLLQSEVKGDMLVTGGDFGLEGSILNTLMSVIAILILIWAFTRKYRSASVATA